MDLIALRTAFFTGVGFFAFFTGFFFATGFFTTGFFLGASSANGFAGRLGSEGVASVFFAAGFAAGFGFAAVFLTTVFLTGAFFGAGFGVARLDRAAFTCIARASSVRV